MWSFSWFTGITWVNPDCLNGGGYSLDAHTCLSGLQKEPIPTREGELYARIIRDEFIRESNKNSSLAIENASKALLMGEPE